MKHADGYRYLLAAALKPLGIQPEHDWRFYARCKDMDPELFFPVGTTGPADKQTQDAKAVCALCPVSEICLQWALDTGQDAGVWGGVSEVERRQMRRRYRPFSHGTPHGYDRHRCRCPRCTQAKADARKRRSA